MARRKLLTTTIPIKAMVWGREGTQKSNLASQLAKFTSKEGRPLRLLYIDLEYKSLSGFNEGWLQSQGVNVENVLEFRTRNVNHITHLIDRVINKLPIQEMRTVVKEIWDSKELKNVKVESEEFVHDVYELDADGQPFIADAIVIDSITILQDMLVEGREEVVERKLNLKLSMDGATSAEKEIALDNQGMQIRDWSIVTKKARKLIKDLVASTGIHQIYVCRAKEAKAKKDVGAKAWEQVGLGYDEPSCARFKEIEFELDLIIQQESDKQGNITSKIIKDSTDTFKKFEIIENLDLTVYEKFTKGEGKIEAPKNNSYEKDMLVAQERVDDTIEETDKEKRYLNIVKVAKEHKVVANEIKKYCVDNGVNIQTPDTISIRHLIEIEDIIQKNLKGAK